MMRVWLTIDPYERVIDCWLWAADGLLVVMIDNQKRLHFQWLRNCYVRGGFPEEQSDTQCMRVNTDKTSIAYHNSLLEMNAQAQAVSHALSMDKI